MQDFGERLGASLRGNEIIELIGDVGAGKTTLVRGIAKGLGIEETVQSPSFTISRLYDAPHGIRLAHYDFYRLDDPGIMANELQEAIDDTKTIVIIEWADAVNGVLPNDKLTITFNSSDENEREVELAAGGPISSELVKAVV